MSDTENDDFHLSSTSASEVNDHDDDDDDLVSDQSTVQAPVSDVAVSESQFTIASSHLDELLSGGQSSLDDEHEDDAVADASDDNTAKFISRKATMEDIRRLLARFHLQRHTHTDEYVNERIPELRQRHEETRAFQRSSKRNLMNSITRLNHLIDSTPMKPLSEGSVGVKAALASARIRKQVADTIASKGPGDCWKALQYDLEGEYHW